MTREITPSVGGTRDVNNTCNILHVARSSQFNTSAVLKNIVVAQGLLASGETLTTAVTQAFGGQTGVSWLGGDSSDVVSCLWVKDIDGVVGTLSTQLKPTPGGQDYLETILPGDLLVVFMDDAGTYDPNSWLSGTLVTVVIVDRVALSTAVQNMAPTNDVGISGRDLAVVLSETSTVFDSSFAEIENGMYTGAWINLLFGNKKRLALSPMENIFNLLLILFDRSATKTTKFPKGSSMSELQWKLSPSGTEKLNNQAKNSEDALNEYATESQVVSLIDVTTYVQNPTPFYALAPPPNIIQAANVWSLLEGYANTTLNEFFIDIRDNTEQERKFRAAQSASAVKNYFNTPDGPVDLINQNTAVANVLASGIFRSDVTQTNGGTSAPGAPDGVSIPALVLRQRPYDAATFDQLPFTEVDSTEVESFEVARSSHDVVNWFRLRFPDIDVQLQEIVAGIRITPQSIAKFGYRRMDAETIYMFVSSKIATAFKKGSTKNIFAGIFQEYMDVLSTWFSQNEYWLAGQMTMRYKPSIRIGTRLRLYRNDNTYDFYVQGVQQKFVKDPGGSRSTFTLTRGRNTTSPSVPLPTFLDFRHDGFHITQGSL